MVKITVTDALRDYLKSKNAFALVVKVYEQGGCCVGGVEPLLIYEPVTDKNYHEKLKGSRYVAAEANDIEIFFKPDLKYVGDEIAFDYSGRIFKDIKCSGVYSPGAFSGGKEGNSIQNIFFDK